MAPKIYTRKGDDGTTGLLFGGRVGKDSSGPDAYGAVDEAVSMLGLARAEVERGSELDELLIRIQRELFVVGAELATEPANRTKLEAGVSRTTSAMVAALEPIIDDVTARYEAPTEFVLPGENRVAAALDVARAVVRRAERQSVAAARAGGSTTATSSPTSTVSPISSTPSPAGRKATSARCAPDRPPASDWSVTVSLSFTVITTPADRAAVELLAVPIAKGGGFGPGADVVDAALGGGLAAFIAEVGFDGALGETLAVPTAGKLRAKAAILVGIGEADALTLDGVRRAAAAIARRASKAASVGTTLVAAANELEPADAAQALAEGFVLGDYQYLDYKGDASPSKLKKVAVIGAGGAEVRHAVARGAAIADAVAWARDMVNTPSKEKSPAEMVVAARRLLRGRGISVQVFEGARLEAERFGGVLGVGQGSEQTPRFLKMTYAPRGARGKALALVGKGVVFDSGGLSLKTAGGMETMKTDMSGGAAVIAAMSTLQDLGVKTRVTGYVPLVENMPSGTAIRPGDVLKIRNGKTVEVLNTDAEGRLILADALSLASDEKPAAVIDLATLTGACMVALGDKIAGLMGNDDAWVDQVRGAADRAGEPVWHLPLPPEYRKQLESEVADMKNIGGSYGGALTAGLFLQEFVDGAPWVHLDIAGPARANADDGYLTKGGTGFGVRTLIELARNFEAPTDGKKNGAAKP